MLLLERAKQTARAADEKKEKEEAEKKRFLEACHATKNEMLQQVIAGLAEFNDVECHAGRLKLLVDTHALGQRYDAIMVLDRSKYSRTSAYLLFIDAGVEHGVADYSDDCRGVAYIEPFVRAYNEKENMSVALKNDRAGLFRFTDSVSGEGNVDRLLVRIADYLAPLFSKK
jgi:hypothetical protein